jgi:integrase
MEAARGNRWGHRDATAILLAYRHGLRSTELVALRWDDIDVRTGKLHVRRAKGGMTSVHPRGARSRSRQHSARACLVVDGVRKYRGSAERASVHRVLASARPNLRTPVPPRAGVFCFPIRPFWPLEPRPAEKRGANGRGPAER